MAKDKTSAQYRPKAIARELRKQGATGEPVAAQVFFADDVTSEALSKFAADAIDHVEKSVGRVGAITLGKVRPNAKSAAVLGDPEAIAALQHEPGVKAVLPDKVDDILPQPRNYKVL